MATTKAKKATRKLTSLELSAPARGALRRIKNTHGISFTVAVSRGVVLLETELGKAAR